MVRYLQTQVESAISCAIQEYSRFRDSRHLVEAAQKLNNVGDTGGLNLSLLLMQMLACEDAEICSALGDRYFQGNGVREDKARSLRIFHEAAERGSVRSWYDLAWYYYERNEYMRAIEYFKHCVDMREKLEYVMAGQSYYFLGDCYSMLPDPKYDQAIEALTFAADMYQNMNAARRLGMLYGMKDCARFDLDKCLFYLEKAANGNDVRATEMLGSYYVYGNNTLGVQRNGSNAERVLLPHVEHGSANVLGLLGDLYMKGDPENGVPRDYEKARGFWEQSLAIKPNDWGEAVLGYVYYYLNQFQKAEKWLLKAEENNIHFYADFLGRMYKCGSLGYVDKDKALYYYERQYATGRMNNVFTCVEYAELLEEAGNCQKAYEVAEHGAKEYNDIWFYYIKAHLVLENLVNDRVSKEQAAEWMLDCIRYDSHTVEAHMALGHYYISARDYRLAEQHYIDAFDKGNYDAAVYLGRLYETGGGSINANPNRAYEWFAKAAAGESVMGQREVACWKKKLIGGWHRVSSAT